MMNEHGKSDRLVVPKKSPNKAGQPVAEEMEGICLAKGNLGQQNAIRTQSRSVAPSELAQIRQTAKSNKDVVAFNFKSDAETFWKELRERMHKFQLKLHPDKTRLLEFGRHASANRQWRGLGKPASHLLALFGNSFEIPRFPLARLHDKCFVVTLESVHPQC